MSTVTYVRTVELFMTELEGFNASMILARQREYYNKVKAEKRIVSLCGQSILSMSNIIRTFRGALEMPSDKLWKFHGMLEGVFDVPMFATSENMEFASSMSVDGSGIRALRKHERVRQELVEVNNELCKKVRDAWDEHLDAILEPRSEPNHEPLADVVPFDDRELDRIMGR